MTVHYAQLTVLRYNVQGFCSRILNLQLQLSKPSFSEERCAAGWICCLLDDCGCWIHPCVFESYCELFDVVLLQEDDVTSMAESGGGHVRRQPEELFEAAAKGDNKLFEELPEQQLLQALSLRNEDGRSLLHVAAAAGHAHVVRMLCDGVDAVTSGINACDDEGWTPLHSAVSTGNGSITEALLLAGADVDTANAGGRTALHYAASKGHSEIARALIKHGAKINKKDTTGSTPLHRAASAGHTEVAEVLIEEGADLEASDNEGQTPLMLATICENRQAALLLVRHGADVDAEDKEGFTVLGRASEDLRPILIETAKAMMEV